MQFLRYATAFCFGGAMAFWIASTRSGFGSQATEDFRADKGIAEVPIFCVETKEKK